MMTAKRNRLYMHKLIDESGQLASDTTKLKEEAVNYFTYLYNGDCHLPVFEIWYAKKSIRKCKNKTSQTSRYGRIEEMNNSDYWH